MPRRHAVLLADVNPQYLSKILRKTYERAPEDFETLLGMEGVGGRTLRALALVSEIIYGTPASTRDPARFSFAHGGKTAFRTRWTQRRTTRPQRRAPFQLHCQNQLSDDLTGLEQPVGFGRVLQRERRIDGGADLTAFEQGPYFQFELARDRALLLDAARPQR